MLTLPPEGFKGNDPRLVMTGLINFDILGITHRAALNRLTRHLCQDSIYSIRGRECGIDDVYRYPECGTDRELIPVHPNDVIRLPVTVPLYDHKHNAILAPVNHSRRAYFVKPAIVLGAETLYAHIYEHICSYSYVNHTRKHPEILTHWNGENYEEFITDLESAGIELVRAVENFITEQPEKVIEIFFIQGHIYLKQFCDYRTWLYIEQEEDNNDE
jgi:hypothetical protein